MEVYELNRMISKWLKWPLRLSLITLLTVGIYLYRFDHPTWMRMLHGTQNLGNNFYSIPWDGGYNIVVYNDNVRNDDVYSGMRVINDSHVEITDIMHNDRWIAMTAYDFQNKTYSWYILDKNCIPIETQSVDSIRVLIQKGLTRYDSEEYFISAMQERHL